MKMLVRAVMIVATFGMAGQAAAGSDARLVSAGADWCFGSAMVGFDSVINSQLDVPAEHAIDMAAMNTRTGALNASKLSTPLLTVILDAYLWEGSPHDYAVNVFYACAQQHAPIIGVAVQ